jgi:hypothetical protein
LSAAIIVARLPPPDFPKPAVRMLRFGHPAASWVSPREWAGLPARRMGF